MNHEPRRRDPPPEEVMAAALGLLRDGGDYRPAYDAFLRLHAAGFPDALPAITEAFYLPNEPDLRARYRNNCRALKKYPFLFRRDFPPFDSLPLRFYPYDENSYVPYSVKENRFAEKYTPGLEVVSRNFFRDLERPVSASDVYSQYELNYLRDNVRRSEDVGRENHIYLHYSGWETFCAYLQVLDFQPLLREKKIVFLMEEEQSLYPIDFAARFGVDYSRFPLRPVGIREITRVIWHAQLSTHNGGDFFNEIFDFHPNLLSMASVLLEDVERMVSLTRELLGKCRSGADARSHFRHWSDPGRAEELYLLKGRTDRDILTALFLTRAEWNGGMDPASRIAPALFFQPHFRKTLTVLRPGPDGTAYPETAQGDPAPEILRGFPYVKTFLPLRRFTTSFAASLRYYHNTGLWTDLASRIREDGGAASEADPLPLDAISCRVMSRNYLADPEERLLRDSAVVRFEDGKTNPRATLTRLAAFLDLPYTESMAYCSEKGERNPHSDLGDDNYAAGFSLSSVYKTYDDYINDSERAFLEFCFRDAYRYYGYDFQWFGGQDADAASLAAWTADFSTQDRLLREEWETVSRYCCPAGNGRWLYGEPETLPDTPWDRDGLFRERMAEYRAFRLAVGAALLPELRFVNRRGVPLRWIPLLSPDPDLLERPLYH